jgi:hypothetical protein
MCGPSEERGVRKEGEEAGDCRTSCVGVPNMRFVALHKQLEFASFDVALYQQPNGFVY